MVTESGDEAVTDFLRVPSNAHVKSLACQLKKKRRPDDGKFTNDFEYAKGIFLRDNLEIRTKIKEIETRIKLTSPIDMDPAFLGDHQCEHGTIQINSMTPTYEDRKYTRIYNKLNDHFKFSDGSDLPFSHGWHSYMSVVLDLPNGKKFIFLPSIPFKNISDEDTITLRYIPDPKNPTDYSYIILKPILGYNNQLSFTQMATQLAEMYGEMKLID
jgi:hypothetical protein